MDPVTVIYLAGPMTGVEDFNYPAFRAAAAKLRAEGHNVISPAEYDRHELEWRPWIDYMRRDLRLLLLADEVRVLPGWEHSRGASLEVHVARELGMKVRELNNEM